MKKVKILPGCIGCGMCQALAPEVFTVADVSHVKEGVDCNKYKYEIEQAVDSCPVHVIEYKQEDE